MVDIFRASEHVMPIVEEALTLTPKPQVIWMQLTVRNDEAAALAEAGRPEGGDEPLPEDRIWPAVVGDFLDGRQFAHAVLEARARYYGSGVQRMGLNGEHLARRRHRRYRPRRRKRQKTAA